VRVLIADDDAATRKSLELTLGELGYEVISCCDGAQAWEHLRADDPPGIAVLGWSMQGAGGPELCRRLRRQDRGDNVYVLLLASGSGADDPVEGIEAGADDYLTQRFDARELEARLRAGRRVLDLRSSLLKENRAKERAMAELARSNEALEEFAYVASHDLQEPLRMVGSYVALLARRYRGRLDSDADDFIDFAVEGVARMRALIRGLLAFARVETRGRKFEPVDCDDALQGALANLGMAVEESDAQVSSDPLPTVAGDATQLTRLLQNLVGNAIRFRSNAPPRVHISASRDGDLWTFCVRDNGAGIDQPDLEEIFLPFAHGRSDAPRDSVGIGLAICRKIVDRHGGKIWAESEPGRGSTFFFTLPAAD